MPQLILRDTFRGSAGLIQLPQKPQLQSQMPSQTYVNYAMGPLHVSFSFRFEPHNNYYILGLVSVMVFAFRFPCGCLFCLLGLNLLGLHLCSLFEFTLSRHVCLLLMVHDSFQEFAEWLLFPLLPVGEACADHHAVPQPFQQYGGAYSFRSLAE